MGHPLYCSCETPVMDVEHDAGCRRCGLPVDFTPRLVVGDTFSTRFESGCVVVEIPDAHGDFVARDSDGELASFSVEMIVAVEPRYAASPDETVLAAMRGAGLEV